MSSAKPRKRWKDYTKAEKTRIWAGLAVIFGPLIGIWLFTDSPAERSGTATGSTSSTLILPGHSYVLNKALAACKSKESFDKLMTLNRAGDKTSVGLYLASDECDILKQGDTVAVTDTSWSYVEVTRYARSLWTARDMLEQRIGQ